MKTEQKGGLKNIAGLQQQCPLNGGCRKEWRGLRSVWDERVDKWGLLPSLLRDTVDGKKMGLEENFSE